MSAGNHKQLIETDPWFYSDTDFDSTRMFKRSKNWLPGALWKPKNPHSLEHLKYLYSILCKNQTVTENNRCLLVETLRSISEILIWGDQHDSSVFDFFLEKNMLSFFLRYLRQKCGRYICVQLLQTLSILFENISNETSLYYLLSNNHINSIIVHKFDFSDEEVMAYYISFLKTLSLKLNRHTIHFFYNEHTNDFALYTEAIKFFNQHETMVRIAVRTITLNVYRVDDKAMLRYIRDRTAAPYFSNLVWFIGNHILDLDCCVRNDADHQSRDRLADLVAEHLDHLHYLNDILSLNIDELNEVLVEHLLNRLLIPLYVYSLTKRKKYSNRQKSVESPVKCLNLNVAMDSSEKPQPEERKHVSSVVSLFLLSQVFLIISHAPLVRQLAEIIFQGNICLTRVDAREDSPKLKVREFSAPEEPLEKTLEVNRTRRFRVLQMPNAEGEYEVSQEGNSTFYIQTEVAVQVDDISSPSTGTEGEALSPSSEAISGDTDISSSNQNSTDEEKLLSSYGFGHRRRHSASAEQRQSEFSLVNRPYLEAIFNALECNENDYETLFALCLLYAMGHNEGIHQGLLDTVLMPTERCETKEYYNIALVEKLIKIITLACQPSAKLRLATLELSIKLLKQLVYRNGRSFLQDRHLACVENARECSNQLLRNFYKSEEIFLDMFEDEYREMMERPLNVEYLTMDASILLPPTGTPLTGIAFNKRLPCGEVERARRAIRVFFLIRDLSLTLLKEEEIHLPLTKEHECIKTNEIRDLNNSDLIACTVVTTERKQERRFLVIDSKQLILVEPDAKRLGWGVVRFVGFLQDVEVSGDKDDSRSLHITVHKQSLSAHSRPVPLLSARFIFDDHIRCMAAKQRLSKGRIKARQQKMQKIERLLDIRTQSNSGTIYPNASGTRTGAIPGRSHPVRASSSNVGQNQVAVSPIARKGLSPSKTGSFYAHMSNKSASQAKQPNTLEVNKVPSNDVEEGIDAVAFQSLNQPCDSKKSHHLGQNTNPINIQEIPLEDLSRKARKSKADGERRSFSFGGTHRSEHSRSHSHSPRRIRSGSSPASYSPDRRSSRVRSVSSDKSRHDRNSDSHSTITPGSCSQSGSQSSSDNSPESAKTSLKDLAKLLQSPKTLRPAEAPTLSLLVDGDTTDTGSPTLLPPMETHIVKVKASSFNGTTSAGTSSTSASDEDNSEDAIRSPIIVPMRGVSSPSVQLTRLAQMVQQHYKYADNNNEHAQLVFSPAEPPAEIGQPVEADDVLDSPLNDVPSVAHADAAKRSSPSNSAPSPPSTEVVEQSTLG
ncbi:protein CLEC16A-like isoform X3 [Argonauta hians]